MHKPLAFAIAGFLLAGCAGGREEASRVIRVKLEPTDDRYQGSGDELAPLPKKQ